MRKTLQASSTDLVTQMLSNNRYSNTPRMAMAVATLTAVSWLQPAQASDSHVDTPTKKGWSVSFGDGWPGSEQVEGSGKLATVQRAVTGFDALDLGSQLTVSIRQGSAEGVTLSGDDNLLALIETEVVGNKLRIEVKKRHHLRSKTPLLVTVDVIALKSLNVSGNTQVNVGKLTTPKMAVALGGSGSVRLDNLSAQQLSVSIGGSGSVVAAGSAPQQNYSIGGSGSIHAEALKGEDVKLSIAGSADAQVNAQKTLTVSVAGSAQVGYSGEPKVKSSVAGSARIRKL